MAAIATRIVLKDFNGGTLHEELTASGLAIEGITWAGFIGLGPRRYAPFPEESRVIGSGTLTGPDVALRGELRFTVPTVLTPAQDTTLDGILAAHSDAVLTVEQTRQDQDKAELDELFTADVATYLDNLQNWNNIATLVQLRAATRVMFVIIGKVLRYVIRKERGGA